MAHIRTGVGWASSFLISASKDAPDQPLLLKAVQLCSTHIYYLHILYIIYYIYYILYIIYYILYIIYYILYITYYILYIIYYISADPSKGEGAREAGILRIWTAPCFAAHSLTFSLIFPILMHSLGDVWHPHSLTFFLIFPILMHSLGDVWHPGSGVPCFAGFGGFAAFRGSQSHFLPYLPYLNAFLR